MTWCDTSGAQRILHQSKAFESFSILLVYRNILVWKLGSWPRGIVPNGLHSVHSPLHWFARSAAEWGRRGELVDLSCHHPSLRKAGNGDLSGKKCPFSVEPEPSGSCLKPSQAHKVSGMTTHWITWTGTWTELPELDRQGTKIEPDYLKYTTTTTKNEWSGNRSTRGWWKAGM